jgi:hypothetical protein
MAVDKEYYTFECLDGMQDLGTPCIAQYLQ